METHGADNDEGTVTEEQEHLINNIDILRSLVEEKRRFDELALHLYGTKSTLHQLEIKPASSDLPRETLTSSNQNTVPPLVEITSSSSCLEKHQVTATDSASTSHERAVDEPLLSFGIPFQPFLLPLLAFSPAYWNASYLQSTREVLPNASILKIPTSDTQEVSQDITKASPSPRDKPEGNAFNYPDSGRKTIKRKRFQFSATTTSSRNNVSYLEYKKKVGNRCLCVYKRVRPDDLPWISLAQLNWNLDSLIKGQTILLFVNKWCKQPHWFKTTFHEVIRDETCNRIAFRQANGTNNWLGHYPCQDCLLKSICVLLPPLPSVVYPDSMMAPTRQEILPKSNEI